MKFFLLPILLGVVARSFSDDNGISHVLPVLWMACGVGNIYVIAAVQQVVINFQRIGQEATLFDLVSDDDMRSAATGWWPQGVA